MLFGFRGSQVIDYLRLPWFGLNLPVVVLVCFATGFCTFVCLSYVEGRLFLECSFATILDFVVNNNFNVGVVYYNFKKSSAEHFFRRLQINTT